MHKVQLDLKVLKVLKVRLVYQQVTLDRKVLKELKAHKVHKEE